MSQQTTDGSFGNAKDIAITSQATGETITALMLDSILPPSALQPTLDYLATGDTSHTETLARQIVAAVTLNGSADNSLIRKLNLLQNENGSFGSYAHYEGDPISTSWALRAYAASRLNNSIVAKAINYLVATVNADKGWRVDKVSSVAVTAEVLIALNAYKQYAGVSQAIASARTYLTTQKNADGLWENDFESALVLSALSFGAPSVSELQTSLHMLESHKETSGGWAEDVYTTALVLQAIKRVNSLSLTNNGNGSVQGQVFLAGSSEPIVNATVSVIENSSSVKTDLNGRFTLMGLKEGLVTLVIQKSGFQSVSRAMQINLPLMNEAEHIYLAQTPTVALLSGHVYDSNTSANIDAARLTISGVTSLNLTTNNLGSFDVTALAAGFYNYTISALGYYSVSGSFSVAAGGHSLINQELVNTQTPLVDNPASVSGVVIDGTTKLPVSFASVLVDGFPLLADINGKFTTSDLTRGNHILSITANGYLTKQFTLNFVAGASGNMGSIFIFNSKPVDTARQLQFFGKCIDGVSGAPLLGVNVKVLNSTIMGITDTQGTVSLNHIPNLQFVLEITATGYITRQYSIAALGFGSVAGTINLTPQTPNSDASKISGVVSDSATNFPLAGVQLSIPGVNNVVTGADGYYEFTDLITVPFTLRATMNGYVPFQKEIDISEASGAYSFDIALEFDNSANEFRILSADTPSLIEPDSSTIINVSVKNISAASQSAILLAHVIDASGEEITVLSPKIQGTDITTPHITVDANQTVNFELPWSVAQATEGTYTIVIEVVEMGTMTRDLPRGHVLASHTVNTLVNGQAKFGGALALSPPLLQAGAETPIGISAVLRNTGNKMLSAGEYTLTIFNVDEASPLFTTKVSADAIAQNGVFTLDFGQWKPAPDAIGKLHAKIVRTDSIKGAVVAELYIGDVARAHFTVDKNVLPEGNNNINANIHLTGVDTSIAKGTDPLLNVVKTAVEKGANFIGPAAKTWQQKNNCLGCHIQSQTLAGLGAALNKTNINQQMANYVFNEITTGYRPSGAFETSTWVENKNASTLMAAWALSEWQTPSESINSLLIGVNYIWSIRQQTGDQLHWSTDYPVGWMADDLSATALATLATVRAKEQADGLAVLPSNYQWNTNFVLNNGRPGHNTLKASDNFIYVAKPNGWLERVDINTKISTVLFTSVAGVSSRINGLEIEENGNFIMATDQGAVVRVNQSGAILNTYQVCARRTGGLVKLVSGEFYVVCHDEQKVVRLTTDGKIQVVASDGLLNIPYGLALHPEGYFLITNYGGGQILKMTTDGQISIYADGFSSRPMHISISPSGDAFVSMGRRNGESVGVDIVRANGTARRIILGENAFGVTVANNQLYVSKEDGSQFTHVKTVPLDIGVLDSYIAALPSVVNYFAATFDVSDLDNINQANRLIGLGEARKLLLAGATRDQADVMITQLVDMLRARQADNGGWGRQGKVLDAKTDALITALVGIALEYTSPSAQDPMIRNSISYLLNMQKANGSWQSLDGLFTTDLGSTSLVMVYLPKAIERLGGLDVKVNVSLPRNVVLSAPTLEPTSQTVATDGTTQYLWDLNGVIGSGRDISFGLAINDLALGEVRDVATKATLSFGNSFTNETIVKAIDIPRVNALSQLILAVTTDKASYQANELVQIASSATNKGPSFNGGDVKLGIRAAGYVGLLDSSIPLNHVTSLPQGYSTSVPNTWNTGTVFAGTYEVFGQLIDAKGRVVAEATAPFIIRGSAASNQLLGSQVFTDKSRYLNSESAHIDARVLNTALNLIHEPVLGRLTVTHTSTSAVAFTHSYAIPQLVIAGQTANQEDLGLTDLASGQYQVLWQVYDAQGVNLISQSTAQFDVVPDVRRLVSGTVNVKSASVERGSLQTCNFSVMNKSATPIPALAVTETVINLDTESVLNTFNLTANLAGNAAQTDTRSLVTAGYTTGQYACVLQAQIEGQTLSLGQALFTITGQPVKLDAELKQQTQGRLLVLFDDANSPDEEFYLRSVLDKAGWLYTIVNNAKDFDTELTQGGYSTYALLSELVTLTPKTRDQLKLLVATGDGLYISNGHDRRHQSLEDALGVRVHSKQTSISGIKFKQSSLGDTWLYSFAAPVNSLTFDMAGATLVGEYVLAPLGASKAGVLGAAEEYNAFVFDDFNSLSSAVEGRLGVGGNLNIYNFGIGEKLDPKKAGDVVVVAGNATFLSGKVYHGNLIAGGSVKGVGASVVNGMAKGAYVKGEIATLPVEFASEQEYLKELSANVAKLPSTGTHTFQYGIYTVKGDCSSNVQVFNISAVELAATNTLYNSCIPVGATIIFNILGDTATLKNMGMQSLTALREKVLFNFPAATKVNMTSVGVEGSVLAPNAQFYNPSGSINGRLIAKSWFSNDYGWVGINNIKFTGDLSSAVLAMTRNAATIHRYQLGKTAFAGFDVLNHAFTLSQQQVPSASNSFEQLLLGSLVYVSPDAISPKANRVMPYKVELQNQATTSVKAKVILTLGNSLTMLNAQGFTASATSGEWVYTTSLEGNAFIAQKFYVQLPKDIAKTEQIRLRVQTGDGENAVVQVDKNYSITTQ
ncbi:MAG: choice-of-anchor A family protein [Pseudomonadota bacterium]